MSDARKSKSAAYPSLSDPKAKAAWRKAAWRDEADDEQRRAAARTVESINQLLTEFHNQRQDLAGFLWAL